MSRARRPVMLVGGVPGNSAAHSVYAGLPHAAFVSVPGNRPELGV
jgi:hypothetical protein